MFDHLRRANMLSPTARCHTLSAAADGYVRSEGGVVFLVRSSAAPTPPVPMPCRAIIVGSAVNQNSQRKPMSAVDPVAQASDHRVITTYPPYHPRCRPRTLLLTLPHYYPPTPAP